MKRHQRRKTPRPTAPAPPLPAAAPPTVPTAAAPEGDGEEYLPIILHLLTIGQALDGETSGVAQRLSQELAAISGGRARLLLGSPSALQAEKHRHVSAAQQSLNVPVQCVGQVFGTLGIEADPARETSPAFSLTQAHLLAQVCGWLLYTLEQSAFLQVQYQQLVQQAPEPLTKREQEVLTLMGYGESQEEIARTLQIAPTTVATHRQHIFERLHVHEAHEALLVAFKTGLFSALKDFSPLPYGDEERGKGT